MSAAASSGLLAAQAGGHPHVADFAPGMTLENAVPSKVSPMMNEADNLWNMGEAPEGRDVGGPLGRDPLTTTPNYVPLLPVGTTNGWQPVSVSPPSPLVHYIGSLRPPGALQPGDETRASFHVVAPASIEPGMKVVIAFFTMATFGGDNPQNPHAYPGDPNYYDLLITGGVGAHFDVVQRNLNRSPTPPYRVLGVQYVPRTSQRPMVSAMQRLRQVRRVVLQLLQQRYGISGSGSVACAVDCASFGGFTAQTALVFYPDEFHAGVAGAFSGAHRSMPSDFGACNSIVVEDLDLNVAGKEVYIGGSSGIRRFNLL